MFQAKPVREGLFFIPAMPDLQISGSGREYSGIDGRSFARRASTRWKSAARFFGSSSVVVPSSSCVAVRLQYWR